MELRYVEDDIMAEDEVKRLKEKKNEFEDKRHKNKMIEIKAEKEAKIEVIEKEMELENLRCNNIMSCHRLKRADKRYEQEYQK